MSLTRFKYRHIWSLLLALDLAVFKVQEVMKAKALNIWGHGPIYSATDKTA